MFGRVKGRISGVRARERGKQGVGILIKNELWRYVKECKEVSPRLMWVRMSLGSEKWVFVSAYGPDMGSSSMGEREAFWEMLRECLSQFGAKEKIVVLGDLNARGGERQVDGITGMYGVPGENENGEWLVELCAERELVIGNTWFKKKLCHKYTWERGDQKSLLDYVLIGKMYVKRLLDVHVKRGVAGGISDHYLVRADVRVKGEWRSRRVNGNEKVVIRVSELSKEEQKMAYKEKIDKCWKEVKGRETRDVEEEWLCVKRSMLEGAREVCGVRKLGNGRMRRGCEWWNEEVRELVEEKRQLFGEYLQNK